MSGIYNSINLNSLLHININPNDDSKDLGFYGSYNDNGIIKYAGLFRDADDKKFKIFHGLDDKPTTTINTLNSNFTLSSILLNNITCNNLIETSALNLFNSTKGDILAHNGTSYLSMNVGTDKYVLHADSTSSTGLSWEIKIPYAILRDVKSPGTNGGGFVKNNWRIRDLNEIKTNDPNTFSLFNDKFTLTAGTYTIEAYAPAHLVSSNKLRIYNVSDSITMIEGTGYNATDYCTATLIGDITITDTKDFELQHYCITSNTNTGFGEATGIGDNEIYSVVKIVKIS